MSERIKVYITRRLPAIAGEMLSRHFIVEGSDNNKPLESSILRDVVADHDAVLSTVTEIFDREILDVRGRLSVISNYAVGLDNIDVQYAQSKNITVYNTPDVVTESTADHTLALLLALIRIIAPARDFVRADKWRAWDPELFLGEELCSKTLGIIGFGKIGKAVAKRAAGFGLRIIYYDHSPQDFADRIDCRQVELDELLRLSDYISIHLPLTEETVNFIDASMIDRMERKPVLLNMARGGIVETDALLEALNSGKIRGAGLDVTAPEPLSGTHPLCQFDNCLIVPHIGTATVECRRNMAALAAQNIIDHFSKQEYK